jgi:hypothetical protein
VLLKPDENVPFGHSVHASACPSLVENFPKVQFVQVVDISTLNVPEGHFWHFVRASSEIFANAPAKHGTQM